MTTHTITLARHTAQVVGLVGRVGVLVLGTWDSYGTEQLLLRPGPEWDGLAIDATFHNVPNDEGVTVLADTDGLVPVPPEACIRPSRCATITFRGVQDGVQRISCNLPYVVLDHAQVPGANSTATPSENAQALAQMQDLRDGAVDAKRHAEAARDAAANSATAAAGSEKAAAGSAAQAEAQKTAAAKSASDAQGYMQTASDAATAANASAENAEGSKAAAASSATAAAWSATAAAGDAKTASDAAAGAADAKAAAVAAQKDAAASKAAAANSSASAKASEDAAAKSAADANSTANSINNSMMQIAALQKRQNVLVGSETGNPIDVDDAFAAPLCGLTVYGRSTQDGTPTPDAPVPIVSAGDGGTIAVTLSDGNGKMQTLTLPTPNGLPGIPVTSGGNYTDQNGQQWVCDEVDLERGVKVQRVNAVDLSTCVITGTTNLVATKRLAIRLPLKGKDYTAKALCNRLPYLVSFTSDTIHFYVDTNNAQVFIPIGAKNPEEGEYILFYVLDAPIETPLTPAEIAAYKAITAYAPDTVVQASDDAGVKLEYQRDVNLVVKNLEDAIASMTTT